MIPGDRQARDDHLRRPVRQDGAGRQGVAQDAIPHLGKDRALVKGDARPASRRTRAEALDDIGPSLPLGISERHQEAAGR